MNFFFLTVIVEIIFEKKIDSSIKFYKQIKLLLKFYKKQKLKL